MNQPELSSDSHVVLLLASHLGNAPDEDDSSNGLGPAGWHDFHHKINRSDLPAVDSLLKRDPEDWPDDIWTDNASREWVQERLDRSTNLAMKLEDLNNRGIWVTTQFEDSYPSSLSSSLGRKAPPFLYVAGDQDNFEPDGVGFVGSRDADKTDKKYTRQLVEKAIQSGYSIISGGARGIDETSEAKGLAHDGPVVEFPAEGLNQALSDDKVRDAVIDGKLTLASHYHPDASWSVGGAMGRNKLIHAMPEYTVVVRSGDGSGGTWEGAIENLSNSFSTLVVCEHLQDEAGNPELIAKGGIPIDPTEIPEEVSFGGWIAENQEATVQPEDSQEANQSRSVEDQSSLDEF